MALEQNEIKTAELAFAAALQCKGYPIVRLERLIDDPDRVLFVFRLSNIEKETVRDNFLNGSMMVDARTYANQLRNIKRDIRNMIYVETNRTRRIPARSPYSQRTTEVY